MVNQQSEHLKEQNKELKQALTRIIPWRDRLQEELKQEKVNHQETKKQLILENNPESLWEDLETYFLVRGLVDEDIKKVYGDRDFKSFIINQIISGTNKFGHKIKFFLI